MRKTCVLLGLSAVVCVLCSLSGDTLAQGVPDLDHCVVPNVYYNPNGTSAYPVTVRDAGGNPLEGIQVRLFVSSYLQGLLCTCSVASSYTEMTDADGIARFYLSGGGCFDPAGTDSLDKFILHIGPEPIVVFRGGVSADAVDNTGRLPQAGWNPNGTCGVGLADAVFFTIHLKSGTYHFCADLNSDGSCNLTDAVILTAPVKHGSACAD